ncbi:ABC transporter permease [Paenibacillus eucommiae]|uniref:Transport permease protein n=1 Tax=Paenibacillus eucommiae TaxID=1355755 RepID=A0ABS4JCT0_9BACL|nr:ABC transporter permease [Paenibacillus eucommiae]MBP1996881.1 ABC-2 type transport system permease protein [Paenibacillus eucommiae]
MNSYLRLMAFDFKLYFRDLLTIFWLLVYPILMLVIFGSIFGDQPGTEPGTRYIDTYVPALCVLNVISVSVFTLNINMVTYRVNGTLRRFRVTPVRASAVLASQGMQGVFLILAGATEIIVLAKLVWDIQLTFSGLLTLIVCLLLGCIGFFSLGFAMSGLTKNAGAASGLAMVIFFPALFLSGIAMPLEIMPQFMQSASKWLPMTYFVDLAQGVWLGHSITEYGLELAVLAGFGMLCVALAFWLFRWEN